MRMIEVFQGFITKNRNVNLWISYINSTSRTMIYVAMWWEWLLFNDNNNNNSIRNNIYPNV